MYITTFFLRNEGAVKILLDACPEKIDAKQVIDLLQLRDEDGDILLHSQGAVKALLDVYPEKIDAKQVIDLSQLRDEDGYTPLERYEETREALEDIFNARDKQLEFTLLSQILKLQDANGRLFFFDENKWRMDRQYQYENLQVLLKQVPERISIDELIELLKVQDRQGKTIFHEIHFSHILPLLTQYPRKGWTEILSLQDRQGNTALHICDFSPTVKQILSHLHPSVMEIPNNLGKMLLDELFKSSKAWLQSPKTTVSQEQLDAEVYEARANALKTQVLSLWDGLSFGEEEEQIPLVFLSSGSNTLTQNEVRAALTTMLDKICQKEAWLGTPPADNLEALHSFYTPMLLNFEKILQKLQEKEDPKEIAGVLFDIAKTQLEERCAAAYQGEIEQACSLILGEEANLSTEALLQTCAKNVLVEAIEEIMRNRNSTNVHTYNQIAFVAGILPARDPLSQFPVSQCRNWLEAKWTTAYLFPALAESFKKIPQEQLFDWFKEKTKEAFGPGYLALKEEVESQEEQILSAAKEALLQKDISDREAEKALELFRSSRGASLVLGDKLIETEQEMQEALTDKVRAFSASELPKGVLEEGLSHLEEKGWQGVFDSIRTTLKVPPKKRFAWQMMSQAFIKSLENAQKIQEEPFTQHLTDEQKRAVLTAKQQFDSQMKALAVHLGEREDIDLSINLKEHGLPSKSVENSRKVAFAASFFNEGEQGMQLKKLGTYVIGEEIGVLEDAFLISLPFTYTNGLV